MPAMKVQRSKVLEGGVVLCTVAMYHVNAIIIQLCSREDLSYADLQLSHTFIRYRACVSAAKLQLFVSLNQYKS